VNSGQMIKRSQALLRAAGATLVRRNSSHEIWMFPRSGAIYPVQLHAGVGRSARGWKNVQAAIRRLARAKRLRGEEVR